MVQVNGWDKFNAWVKSIHDSPDLTKKEKKYIDGRIEYELNNDTRHERKEDYWNDDPIELAAMWVFTDEDEKNGVRKASELGF